MEEMLMDKKEFLQNCSAEMKIIKDKFGREIHVLTISNGLLSFSVLPERGMDIGEIFLGEEKVSWERTGEALLHPDSVDLHADGGWDSGFFGAVASLGPEVFGTPDEIRTPHGTGSYSPADMDSLRVYCEEDKICVEGIVPIRGYWAEPVYEKKVIIRLAAGATVLEREEITGNLTDERQPLDDGYHIQLAGEFMAKGGRYVLPTSKNRMLLRDSVPSEENPKEIYDFTQELNPIRCYQYVPEEVKDLTDIKELAPYASHMKKSGKLTSEMWLSNSGKEAGFIIRPLSCFPRTLIAKRAITEPMYAIEPCKTRPNSIRQKAIDGELVYLEPHGEAMSRIWLGVLKDTPSVLRMARSIEYAEYHVSDLF